MVEDTRSLIQTLVTAYRERKAGRQRRGRPQTSTLTALWSSTPLPPLIRAAKTTPPASPLIPRARLRPRPRLRAPCPYGSHIPECQCIAEAEDLYGLARKHLRQSRDHPP